MGKFTGVLLVSDFDDTLCGTDLTGSGPDLPEREDGPLLSAVNQRALDDFIAQGGVFTVATGRAHRTFARFAPRLPLGAPAVLSNGSVIYDFAREKELFHAYLRPEVVADVRALAQAMPEVGFEVQFAHTVCIYQPNDITWRHLHRLALDYEECPLEDMPQPWGKLVLEGTHQVLLEAQSFLLGRWGGHYEAIFSNNHLLEVTPKGCHKGAMVLRVAQQMGIRRENLYCVGDNQNDIPMLAVSAIPFAPANCAQVVRDFGARILRSCDEGCVAHVVEELDKLY